ncbi:tRNA pseudouridine(13) synthase TruD [Candidatus Bathycorpusculum sp.]|uniref:tRNA pseudouridine(13) synthase TruD n=1 Tax=Candidatus Bathycorpusculum sp. TaxID=2994959 RepID=UPI0028392237|nr:tRNA pseudouridine(13) synthase TruD [Candidatus Termitimicrobium sp.]MCL2685450.1 tRNA pseudouridine(13) synthase TruD [Candidatus Termitimicrobium sp.]
MSVSELDKLLGMEVYATKTSGIGGTIKTTADDFIVEELLVDGSKASITGDVPNKALGSTSISTPTPTPTTTAQRQRYLLCSLVKRNWDTFTAIKNLAKALNITQAQIQFAGIKDAKALTAQHLTIENIHPENLTQLELKDAQIHPIGYIREMLSLFYLLGNNFTITIKNLTTPPTEVKEQIEQTTQELTLIGGIPNFFGHQRFGTTRPITHLVGKALLEGKIEEAALTFLANPSPHEHPQSRQSRQELQETNNFKQAAQTFPKQLRYEKLMLNHLAENPQDFTGAFQRLPPKLQALFVQAHQSYLFNRFLSARINHDLPLNIAQEGDFVVNIERTGLPLTTAEKIVTPQNINQINEALKAGKMRVALPLWGFKQKLSSGIMGEIEQTILKQEGLEPENLQSNPLSRISGRGSLRTTTTPLKNFTQKNNPNPDSITLSFMLLRGSYATVYLRELMKPINPLNAGF